MTKTSLHAQGWDPWLLEYLAASGARWIKFVNWFPEVPARIIGRVHVPEEESNVMVSKGEVGAVEFYNRVRPEMDKNRHVTIWEGPNEVSIWQAWVLQGFYDFYQKLIELYHADGFPIMAGQINTGWPYLPEDDGGGQSAVVGRAIQGADGVSFHEYDPVDLRANPGLCAMRYQKTVAYWRSLGLTVPPVHITELGLDRTPGPDFGHSGWKIILDGNLQAYIEQLCWYEAQIQADPDVVAATVFSVVTNWNSFSLDREQSLELARALAQVEPPPPPPPPPPTDRARGLDVCRYQGEINWEALRVDGYSFAMIRASGPNNDRTGVEVDPMFAVNYAGAGEAGLLRGAYHGLVPGFGGQAKLFVVDAVAGRELELGYWSDLENMELTDDKCAIHLEAVDARLMDQGLPLEECRVDIYTNPNFMNHHEGLWAVGRKLWVAHWRHDPALEPIIPQLWNEWEFWQWTNEGTEVPGVPNRTCLDVYNGTTEELYEEYGDPNGGNGGDPVIEIVDRNGNPVIVDGETWTWETVQRDFGLSLTEADPPEGATVFKLARLIYDASGETNWRLYVLDEEGKPLPGIVGFMGIYPDSGTPLDDDQAPRLSEDYWTQPEGRPNRALVLQPNDLNFTNMDGYIQHSLGSGSNYVAPVDGGTGGGGHWAWIMPGDHQWFSDVPAGFGMFRNHEMFWPVFQMVTEEEPQPPPPDDLVAQVARCADALERIERDGLAIRFTCTCG